jgi:GGDEF domain-containing protein
LPCGERTIVGRWADDQFFLVILNDCSGDSLRAVGNRTNRMLASDGMEWRGAKRSVSVSIGHAVARAGAHARAGEAEHANRLNTQDPQCEDLQLKDLLLEDLQLEDFQFKEL